MSASMNSDVSSVKNEVSSVNDPKPFTPFTGPGSVYKVFEQYNKSKYNASGEEPVCPGDGTVSCGICHSYYG